MTDLLELVGKTESKQMNPLLIFEFFMWDTEGKSPDGKRVIYKTQNEIVTLSHCGKPTLTLGCDGLESPEVFVLTPPTQTHGLTSMGELIATALNDPQDTNGILVLNDLNRKIDWDVSSQNAYVYDTWGDFATNTPSEIIKCDGVIVSIEENHRLFFAQPHAFLGGIAFYPVPNACSLGVSAYNGNLCLEILTPFGYYLDNNEEE